MISWNGAAEKYDIRDWAPEHEKMGKGITLSQEEAEALYELLGKTLKKFNPAHQHQPAMHYVVETTASKQKIPVVGLFTENKAIGTLLIWSGFAMVMLMV